MTTVMAAAVIVAVAVFIAALVATGVVAIKRIKKFTEDWDKYQKSPSRSPSDKLDET